MLYLMRFFVDNWRFTVILSLFVCLFGINGALSLKSETFPSVNIGAVVITTPYAGATASDIEAKITKPIEDEIQKVSGLKRVKSTSQAGLSTIVTEVDIDKFEVEPVIADLQRAVDRTVGLPADLLVRPTLVEIKSDEFPVIELAVVGPNTGRFRDKVVDELKDDNKDIRAVSSVLVTGAVDRRFNILLDSQKMRENHVSIAEVQRAIADRNVTIPGGALKTDLSQTLVRIEGKSTTTEELGQIVVRSNFSGQRVRLLDVATIEDAVEDPDRLASINGEPATFLTITKKGGADLIKLASDLDQLIQRYSERHRADLKFMIFNNEGVRVGDRLAVLTSNGWQGIVLVLVLLLVFLRGRVGFVTSMSLPLALLATMGSVHLIGYSLNTITIIALVIAIGMLVDNAVVVSENYVRLRDEGATSKDALTRTLADLWAPVTATAMTTIAAFTPMLVTTGVMGQFIKAIPIVVSLSLMLSLVESFFLLPTRLQLVGYKASQEKQKAGIFDRWIAAAFERQLRWLVSYRWLAAILFLTLIGGTFASLAFLNRFNLFPSEQTEIYVARIETAKGSRVEETSRLISEYTKVLSTKLADKVVHVVGVAGESAFDVSDPKGEFGTNTAMIRIFVNRKTQDSVDTDTMLAELRQITHAGLIKISWEALVNGPPVGDPVSVTLRSNNSAQLAAAAQHMKLWLEQQKGVFDPKIDDIVGEDEIMVRINHDAAARVGLGLAEIGSSIRTAVAGQKVTDVNVDNKTVDYFVRFDDRFKTSEQSLSQIKISDRFGNLIPLGSLATFERRGGEAQIKRYDFRPAKTVTANLDTTLTTSFAINELIAEEFKKKQSEWPEVGLVFGGEAEKTNESVASLFKALILSGIGIFALLVLIFGSWSSPFIILTTIPLGLVGVSFAFWLHQRDLSFMALVGVVGLGGIIVNSGIILISFIEQMRLETKLSLDEILVKASVLRLRAVLVTSLTTIGGLVPTAYGIGGVDYFIIPMALALAWGISTGTVLTLYWVPPAYGLVEDVSGLVRRLLGRAA